MVLDVLCLVRGEVRVAGHCVLDPVLGARKVLAHHGEGVVGACACQNQLVVGVHRLVLGLEESKSMVVNASGMLSLPRGAAVD